MPHPHQEELRGSCQTLMLKTRFKVLSWVKLLLSLIMICCVTAAEVTGDFKKSCVERREVPGSSSCLPNPFLELSERRRRGERRALPPAVWKRQFTASPQSNSKTQGSALRTGFRPFRLPIGCGDHRPAFFRGARHPPERAGICDARSDVSEAIKGTARDGGFTGAAGKGATRKLVSS